MRQAQRLLILSHDLGSNAAGRAHVIWSLAQHIGVPAKVFGVSRQGLWSPLQDDDFAEDVTMFARIADMREAILQALGPGDVLLPIKTWPSSLGVALDCAQATGAATLVDIDDPDHSALVGEWSGRLYRHAFRTRMRFRGESPQTFDHLEIVARSLPRLVANPTLQQLYGGGWIVPHARSVPASPLPLPKDSVVRVAFVGTPRSHKGIAVLREAVSAKARDGFILTVTAPPPRDAEPWERWVGHTSLAQGRRLLGDADLVVIPQLEVGYGRAQLPAKLIDAMACARPVIASATPPIEWALGGTGLLLARPDASAIIEALDTLDSPEVRSELGAASHARAKGVFSLEAVGEVLARALSAALNPPDS